MFDRDKWSEIWASIQSNKLRTSLSGLTITMALFVFITLFGLGNGLQNGFMGEFFSNNSMNISIRGGRTSIAHGGFKKGRIITLKMNDYEFLKTSFENQIKYIAPLDSKTLMVKGNITSDNYTIKGIYPQHELMNTEKVTKGTYIKEEDIKQNRKVAVIGRLAEFDLFKGQPAIGKNLNIGGNMYEITGVFSSPDGGDNVEREILVPLSTLHVIYASDTINNINITPKDNLNLQEIGLLANSMENALKRKHGVNQDDSSAFRVNNAAEAMSDTNSFLFVLTVIVFIIGGGSLIAGIVSIANIMVFSVKERTKEIGIRKALGATPANIVSLIMTESVMLTLIFGALGIILATILVENLGDSLSEFLIHDPGVSSTSLIMACIILFVCGFIAGFIPARNAAKIKTIDALRSE